MLMTPFRWCVVGLDSIPFAPFMVASGGPLPSVWLSGRQGEPCSVGPLGAKLIQRVSGENLLCAIQLPVLGRWE